MSAIVLLLFMMTYATGVEARNKQIAAGMTKSQVTALLRQPKEAWRCGLGGVPFSSWEFWDGDLTVYFDESGVVTHTYVYSISRVDMLMGTLLKMLGM
jgi:hypothetical protein